MSKRIKEQNIKENKLFRTVIIVLGCILAVVVIANLAFFSYISINRSKAEKALAEEINTAVDSCVETLNDFEATDEQLMYIDTYKQNIADAKTTLQKAYLANAMLTYAINSTNTINSERITEAANSGTAIQSKQLVVTELTNIDNELQQAIYAYTIYDEN
jgi:hypothetical protein